MPYLYPEQLAELRAANPGLQYDGRGNIIGAEPSLSQQAYDAFYNMAYRQPNAWDFGPTRADYQNSMDFVGPVTPEGWQPSAGLADLMSGRDLQPRRSAGGQNPYAPSQRGFSQSDAGYEPQSSLPLYQEAPVPGSVQLAAGGIPDAIERARPYMPLQEQDMRAYRLLGGNPDVGSGTLRNPINRFLDWTGDVGARASDAQDWAEGIY